MCQATPKNILGATVHPTDTTPDACNESGHEGMLQSTPPTRKSKQAKEKVYITYRGNMQATHVPNRRGASKTKYGNIKNAK